MDGADRPPLEPWEGPGAPASLNLFSTTAEKLNASKQPHGPPAASTDLPAVSTVTMKAWAGVARLHERNRDPRPRLRAQRGEG